MSVEVRIVEGPLGPMVAAPADGAGAVVCFEGVVRPLESGDPIDALDYEAYRPMAEQMLERLGSEVCSRFGLMSMLVEHSSGRVDVGACSFRLVVRSAHRAEALEAMGEFIDRMKKDVPLWKRPVRSLSRTDG